MYMMQEETIEKQILPSPPDVRSLAISKKIRVNRYSRSTAPEIRLCGTWLEELGFCHGQRVTVTTVKGFMVIRPVVK